MHCVSWRTCSLSVRAELHPFPALLPGESSPCGQHCRQPPPGKWTATFGDAGSNLRGCRQLPTEYRHYSQKSLVAMHFILQPRSALFLLFHLTTCRAPAPRGFTALSPSPPPLPNFGPLLLLLHFFIPSSLSSSVLFLPSLSVPGSPLFFSHVLYVHSFQPISEMAHSPSSRPPETPFPRFSSWGASPSPVPDTAS